MELKEALKPVYAPQGATTVIGGLMSGDLSSLKHNEAATTTALEEAETRLQEAQAAMKSCGSDWAYWGHAGEVAYWSCVRDILEAATICGADNLPDVDPPSMEGLVVMDAQGRMADYGRKVLAAAKQAVVELEEEG